MGKRIRALVVRARDRGLGAMEIWGYARDIWVQSGWGRRWRMSGGSGNRGLLLGLDFGAKRPGQRLDTCCLAALWLCS